jgi:hypothetical protein
MLRTPCLSGTFAMASCSRTMWRVSCFEPRARLQQLTNYELLILISSTWVSKKLANAKSCAADKRS